MATLWAIMSASYSMVMGVKQLLRLLLIYSAALADHGALLFKCSGLEIKEHFLLDVTHFK